MLEGKNQMEMKDINGKPFIQEMIKTAMENGFGWVDYQWPKPGTTKAVRKSSFVKKIIIKGDVLVVGTGVYLD